MIRLAKLKFIKHEDLCQATHSPPAFHSLFFLSESGHAQHHDPICAQYHDPFIGRARRPSLKSRGKPRPHAGVERAHPLLRQKIQAKQSCQKLIGVDGGCSAEPQSRCTSRLAPSERACALSERERPLSPVRGWVWLAWAWRAEARQLRYEGRSPSRWCRGCLQKKLVCNLSQERKMATISCPECDHQVGAGSRAPNTRASGAGARGQAAVARGRWLWRGRLAGVPAAERVGQPSGSVGAPNRPGRA